MRAAESCCNATPPRLRDQLYSGHGAPSVTAGAATYGGGIGDQFIGSDQFKSIADPMSRPERFTSGAVNVGLAAKGTLLETAGGGGLPWVSVPQVVPGAVDRLFQRLTFESLLLSGQATGPTVRYLVEGTATSGAAGVGEGALKPESTVGFTSTDESVKKIATVLPVSDEMLEDAPALRSFLNSRLAFFVSYEVERQLLRGTSGGNEIQGLLTSRGVPVYAGGTAAGDKSVQLFKAMNGVRGSAFVEPDFIVLNPTDYESIRLLKDTAGQYFGGGPYQGPYGSGVNVDASGQVTGANDYLWNKAVYVTSALGAGTALVGTRSAAQVMSRGGLSVEVSNSHDDFFQRNMIAIRAERRAALCVFRPAAFCEVRLA